MVNTMRILSMTAQKVDSTGSGVFLTELVKCFEEAGHQQAVICGCTHQDTIQLPASVRVFPVYYNTSEVPFPVCGMSDEMPYESTRYSDMTDSMTRQLFAAFRKRIRKAVETFHPDVILCHHLYFRSAESETWKGWGWASGEWEPQYHLGREKSLAAGSDFF